jgi:hypothetical protein
MSTNFAEMGTAIDRDTLLREINVIAHTSGVNASVRDRLQFLHRAVRKLEAEVREDCAKIADQYAAQPLGGPEQDSEDAFLNGGMTYTTGGADTASAIAQAIRTRGQRGANRD